MLPERGSVRIRDLIGGHSFTRGGDLLLDFANALILRVALRGGQVFDVLHREGIVLGHPGAIEVARATKKKMGSRVE